MFDRNQINQALEVLYDRVGKHHHSVDGILHAATHFQDEERVASIEEAPLGTHQAPLARLGILLANWWTHRVAAAPKKRFDQSLSPRRPSSGTRTMGGL